MNNKHAIRNFICIVLVALYFIGLVLLILGNVSTGITLWALSTIVGALVLYIINRAKEKKGEGEDEGKKEQDA